MTTNLANHPVVSRQQWLAERRKLLAREKELTRLSDKVARERQALPWVRLEKNYQFDTQEGRRPLADLFDGRRQLLMQHFMLAPGWEEGCKSCSYMADHTDPTLIHLAARDVTFVAVSRAPLVEIERFRKRMGWQFRWVSSHGSEFNHDFGVSFTADELASGKADYNFGGTPEGDEMPGVSAFWKDDVNDPGSPSTPAAVMAACIARLARTMTLPFGRADRRSIPGRLRRAERPVRRRGGA
jgi:predicted dithiol-disulfide oxidoreductase (DUF899 family)